MNKHSPLYPVFFILILAAIFGTAVASVALYTRPLVEVASVARLRSHVLNTLGLEAPEDHEELATLWTETVKEKEDQAGTYYIATSKEGQTLGYVLPFTSPGFWGSINGVVAVNPTGDKILGISFTAHSETPGLGGRISEEWFTEQFRGKRIDTARPSGKVLDFVYRKAVDPFEVEAITGATQTSSRLDIYLNQYLSELKGHPAFVSEGSNQ